MKKSRFLHVHCITSQALLTGCSAGGLATLVHCDDFRELLSKDTDVKCLADAGFFPNVYVLYILSALTKQYWNHVMLGLTSDKQPTDKTYMLTVVYKLFLFSCFGSFHNLWVGENIEMFSMNAINSNWCICIRKLLIEAFDSWMLVAVSSTLTQKFIHSNCLNLSGINDP